MQYNYGFHLHHQLVDASHMLGESESFYYNRNVHQVSWYGKPYFVLPPHLTLFRMGLFRVAHGGGGGGGDHLPKICRTYPTMIKLGTVILYLKKNQKIYKSRDTLLEF